MIEEHFSELIVADAAMLALVDGRAPELWYFGPSSLGIGPNAATPDRPFVVWNELPSFAFPEVRGTSNAERRSFTWYVYDFMGDYLRINAILREIRRIVKGIAPVQLQDGTRVSESLWAGMSENIASDGYDSSVRFGTGRFVVSQ